LPLPALEPTLAAITEWAQPRSIVVHEGILELGSALPEVTVVGFDPDDIELFLTLAGALDRPVVVVNPLVFDEQGLRLATALVQELREPKARRFYNAAIADAKPHLGHLQQLTVHAFSGDLTRVVTFRAATDWGEPLLNLGDDFEEE
jgi:hypothetical protein